MGEEKEGQGAAYVSDMEFGECNVSAPYLGLGRVIGLFPWNELFAALGLPGTYPTILYQSEEAEAIFEQLSSELASLAIDERAWYAMELNFGAVYSQPPGYLGDRELRMIEDSPIGILTIDLHLPKCQDRDESQEALIRRLLCLAIARYHAGAEAHGHRVQIELITDNCYRLS